MTRLAVILAAVLAAWPSRAQPLAHGGIAELRRQVAAECLSRAREQERTGHPIDAERS